MIKKILGVIFIVLALILGLSFLVSLPKTLLMLFSSFSAYSLGYAISSFIFLIISILLFKLGLKWLKNKHQKTSTIDQIGKN